MYIGKYLYISIAIAGRRRSIRVQTSNLNPGGIGFVGEDNFTLLVLLLKNVYQLFVKMLFLVCSVLCFCSSSNFCSCSSSVEYYCHTKVS